MHRSIFSFMKSIPKFWSTAIGCNHAHTHVHRTQRRISRWNLLQRSSYHGLQRTTTALETVSEEEYDDERPSCPCEFAVRRKRREDSSAELRVETFNVSWGCAERRKDGSLARGRRKNHLYRLNNQLSRKVWKATGIRSTVSSSRKPIFAIAFESTKREREKTGRKDPGYFKRTPAKFLVRTTIPQPSKQPPPPPCDPPARGIDSCSVLCAITTILEYKSTAPTDSTEMAFSRGVACRGAGSNIADGTGLV